MINSLEIAERFIDELSPTNDNEENDNFPSLELMSPDEVPKKREARPIIGLIMDILDTVYKSSNVKRKGSQFT